MRRTIGLLVTLALSLLAAPLAAAQPQAALPRIGYLGDMPELFTDAFRQGLRELGYIEGQNLAVEYRWAEGQADRLRDLAADLAQLKMDVLVTAGRPRAVRPSTPPARSPLSWRTWAIPWGWGWSPASPGRVATARASVSSGSTREGNGWS
jgi:putative tryptophan/tyrosine transport system substrate-binding protein